MTAAQRATPASHRGPEIARLAAEEEAEEPAQHNAEPTEWPESGRREIPLTAEATSDGVKWAELQASPAAASRGSCPARVKFGDPPTPRRREPFEEGWPPRLPAIGAQPEYLRSKRPANWPPDCAELEQHGNV
jgi:hypothetical protein